MMSLKFGTPFSAHPRFHSLNAKVLYGRRKVHDD